MKKIIIVLIVVAVALLAFKALQKPAAVKQVSQEPRVTYSDGIVSVTASFDTTANTVTFTEPTLGTVTLPQAISGSGARYANEDESIVFWEHQGEATITKNGETVFVGPVVAQ